MIEHLFEDGFCDDCTHILSPLEVTPVSREIENLRGRSSIAIIGCQQDYEKFSQLVSDLQDIASGEETLQSCISFARRNFLPASA